MDVAVTWVTAARAGDADAFGYLVRSELPGAYRIALSILRSPADAEDAVQDAFLRAWRDVRDLRSVELWPAWFRRLVVNASLDRARKRHGTARDVDLAAVGDLATADSTAGISDRLEVLGAFGRLRPDDRAILALRFLDDLEVPDIAATLGIPLGTAKSRLHRALGRLEDEMRRTR